MTRRMHHSVTFSLLHSLRVADDDDYVTSSSRGGQQIKHWVDVVSVVVLLVSWSVWNSGWNAWSSLTGTSKTTSKTITNHNQQCITIINYKTLMKKA